MCIDPFNLVIDRGIEKLSFSMFLCPGMSDPCTLARFWTGCPKKKLPTTRLRGEPERYLISMYYASSPLLENCVIPSHILDKIVHPQQIFIGQNTTLNIWAMSSIKVIYCTKVQRAKVVDTLLTTRLFVINPTSLLNNKKCIKPI